MAQNTYFGTKHAAAGRLEARKTPSSCVFRAKIRILSQNHRRKTLDRKMHLTNSFQLSPLSRATEVDKPCVVLRRLISPKRYNLHRTPGSSGSCVFRAKKRILSQNCPRNTLDRKMHITNSFRLSPLSRATKAYKPCVVLRRLISPDATTCTERPAAACFVPKNAF